MKINIVLYLIQSVLTCLCGAYAIYWLRDKHNWPTFLPVIALAIITSGINGYFLGEERLALSASSSVAGYIIGCLIYRKFGH